MKKTFLLLVMAFALHTAHAQFVHKVNADSVLLISEFNLENNTKHVNGFLYNKGNGRTEFRKVVKLNDSTFIFGADTLVIGGNVNASNGIIKSGNRVELGQTIGASGNAADFTSDREIPLAGNRLHFKDGRITMKLSTLSQPAIQITDSANNSLLMIRAFSQIDPTNSRVTSIFIGDSAGYKAIAIPGPTTNGVQRIGIGHKALFEDEMSNFSTAIGGHAMAAAGYKPWSTALGYSALRSATNGAEDNTALGYVTLYSMQTGKGNIGIGSHAMQRATHIDSSVGIGVYALGSSNAIGGNFRREVAIGMAAGRQSGAFTGSGNVRIGFRAGQDIGTTASGNVLIGHDVARGIDIGNNKLYIANTNTSNPLLYGEFDNAFLRVGGRLKINNVPLGSSADSVLVWNSSDSLVKKVAPSAYGWQVSGNGGTNPTNNFLGTTDSQDLVMRTNNIEKVRVGVNGNVGIGSNNPAYPLEIIDTLQTHGNVVLGITTNSNTYSRIQINDKNSGPNAGAGILMTNNAAQGFQLYMGSTNNYFVPAGALLRSAGPGGMNIVTDAGPLAFGKSAYMGGNEFARFLNNGNFGIGTQTPAYKLDVNGKLAVRTIDSTASAANMLYQDAATGEIKKAALPVTQTFAQIATATVSGDAETTLIASGTGSLTIPAAAWFAGKTFRIVVKGFYSTDVNNPAGIGFKIKLGSTVIAQSTGTWLGTNKIDIPYELVVDMTCRATGASGSLFAMGTFNSGDQHLNNINNGKNATAINLSNDQTLNITATLSDGSAGNAISAFIVILEAIN